MDDFIEAQVTLRINPLLGKNGEVFLEAADGGRWEIESIADFEDSFGIEFPNKTFYKADFDNSYTLQRDGSVRIETRNGISTYTLDLDSYIRCFRSIPDKFFLPVIYKDNQDTYGVSPWEAIQIADYYDLDIVIDGCNYTVVKWEKVEVEDNE